MKIRTITCHNAVNYGARLQACALLHYLSNLGHDVQVIDYRPSYMSFREKVWYWPGSSVKAWIKLFLRFRQRLNRLKQYAAFEKFSEKYLSRTTRIYHNIAGLKEKPPHADLYIAGSDQIWNTLFCNGTDAAYYLDFGPLETKRISYAASFALSSLAIGCEAFVRENLSAFDAISVRETSGLQILNSLDFSGRIVADPVFLLSAEEWDLLLSCRETSESYVLVYDVMGCNQVKRLARRIAKQLGCNLYAIGYRNLGYADRNFSRSSPDTFVELIRNARFVVSNSFHGTAFAMIYHKDFFVVDRTDGLNERMHDLLSRCGLSSRRVTADLPDNQLLSAIPYRTVDMVLQREIVASKAFLAEELTQ